MRPLPETLVFARPDLRALGWSDPAISRAVRSGRLYSVRRGYLARPVADPVARHLLAATAAAHAATDGAVSHRSGLLVHELPLVGARPPQPEVTVPPRQLGHLAGAHLYRATLPSDAVTTVRGARVTSVARTLIDVARHRPVPTAVAAIDAALNRGLVSEPELIEVVLTCWYWPRIRRAIRALRLVDGRAESPLESVSRLAMLWLRLPAPDLQARFVDSTGRFLARTDFHWPQFGVVGEADGAMKYTAREVLMAEKRRQEALEDLGLIVVRWGWDDVTRRPRHLAARIEAAFERGRTRNRSGFRPQWPVSAA
jgi:hypothetical protein